MSTNQEGTEAAVIGHGWHLAWKVVLVIVKDPLNSSSSFGH